MRTLTITAAVLALAIPCCAQDQKMDQKTQIKKVPIPYTSPTSGVEMFRSYCAPCHGNDGKGAGPAAASLKTPPANLTMLNKKNNGKFPEAEVANTIKGEGTAPHGSRDMPMWGDIFRSVSSGNMGVEMRVKNLSDYIRSIQEK
jgi:mono/diheme cytochrome c family protein